jgi:hypothetical protein
MDLRGCRNKSKSPNTQDVCAEAPRWPTTPHPTPGGGSPGPNLLKSQRATSSILGDQQRKMMCGVAPVPGTTAINGSHNSKPEGDPNCPPRQPHRSTT